MGTPADIIFSKSGMSPLNAASLKACPGSLFPYKRIENAIMRMKWSDSGAKTRETYPRRIRLTEHMRRVTLEWEKGFFGVCCD